MYKHTRYHSIFDTMALSNAFWAVFFIVAAVAPQTVFAAQFATVAPMNSMRQANTATLLPSGKVLVVGGTPDNSAALSSTELYDPSANTWTTAASLTTGRHHHTATLLLNGKVLVAGGNTNGSYTNSAEIYDPSTNSWSAAGNLTTARATHSATLLLSGKVLVEGGGNGGYLNSAEIYDPSTNAWTPAGTMTSARGSFSATLLPSGKVLVAGGFNGNYVSGAELYDPTGNSWSTAGNLNTARNQHTATLLPNGKVLLAGGYNASVLNSAELYDPAAPTTWGTTGTLNTGRFNHSATLLPNGKLLVIGGQGSGSVYLTSAELYDPVATTWTATTSLNSAHYTHAATLLASGSVLVEGGIGTGGVYLNSAEIYDSTSGGAWSSAASLGTARHHHTATLLPSGKVLVTAGEYDNASGQLSSAEIYDSINNLWSTAGNLAAKRFGHTATLLPSGKVLVAGGYNTANGYLSGSELYDPSTNTWSAAGSLLTERSGQVATLLASGNVLVAGGQNDTGYLGSAELYDPSTNTWSTVGSLSTVRGYGHTATLLPSGKVLVSGGFNGSYLNTAELYDPSTNTWTAVGNLSTRRYLHTATLLPSGKVLVAAGNNNGVFLNSSELYDPATNTFTVAGNLTNARYIHTATLVSNGKVLVAAGDNVNGELSSAELYDPETDTWSAAGSLSTARRHHRATLLPNGKVLVSGGELTNTASSSAELFDPGLGFTVSNQPVITTATSPLTAGGALVLTGAKFKGVSEASGGSANNSATNYPLVQVRSLENEQSLFLTPDPSNPFSDTNYTSKPFSGLPFGYATVTVFVNGIPSNSKQIQLAPVPVAATTTVIGTISPATGIVGQSVTVPFNVTSATQGSITGNVIVGDGTTTVTVPVATGTASLAFSTAGPRTITVAYQGDINYSASAASASYTVNKSTATFTLSKLIQTYDGAPKPITVTSVPANLAVTVTYNGSLTPPTNVGHYPVAVSINDANYTGSANDTLTILAPSTVSGANQAAVFNVNAQTITLSGTVASTLPALNLGAVNEGALTFQILDGSTPVGTQVTSSTVVNGAAQVAYLVPAFTLPKAYSIQVSYSGGSTFAASMDATKSLLIQNGGNTPGNPPVIDAIMISRNPVRTNTVVTFTALARSTSGLPIISDEWFFYYNDSPTPDGPSIVTLDPVSRSFASSGTYTVAVVASDGISKSAQAKTFTVTLDPNPGTSAKNIFNNGASSNGFTNPANNLGLAISDSLGGVLHIDTQLPAGTNAQAADIQFNYFLDGQPITIKGGTELNGFTASKYIQPGIKVIEVDTITNGLTEKARLMVPVSDPEVGNSLAITDTRTSKGTALKTIKGKFSSSKQSFITLTTSIEISAGLTLDQLSPFEFGVSNLHTTITIDTKGKVLTNSNPQFKSIKVKMPKVDKLTHKTVQGATMTLTFTVQGLDLSKAGFDTDGIVPIKPFVKGQALDRKFQFAAFIAGMTYQGLLNVVYSPDNEFGTIGARH